VPEELPLFPLNTVLFPGMPLPLHIFEYRYREMIAFCSENEKEFGVVLIKEGTEVGEPATPFEVGTMARIIGIDRLEDGRMNIVTVGTRRFRVLNVSPDKKSYIVGDIEPLPDENVAEDPNVARLAEEVGGLLRRYAALVQAGLEQDLTPLELPGDPEALSYLAGGTLRIRNRERQRLLELPSTAQRLELEKEIFEREAATLQEFIEQRKGGLGPFSRN
jgi:Lon protease-like protein